MERGPDEVVEGRERVDAAPRMEEPEGGCAVHGAALLIASAAAIALMAAFTFGCWLLYRLLA